jgi:hypothetical protein
MPTVCTLEDFTRKLGRHWRGGGGKQCYTILRSSSPYSLTDLASYALALSVHTKAPNIPRAVERETLWAREGGGAA